MNYDYKKISDMENRTGLNAEDFILLCAAKGGDDIACSRLYLNHQDEVVNMHKYGPDGTNPKNFGFSKSYNGATYEEASGYCYLCFHECVARYNMNSGKAFMAWVRGIFAKRGLDWVEDRNPDHWDRDEESVQAASEDVFRQDDIRPEVSHEEELLTSEGVEQIRSYINKAGDDNLKEFLEAWLTLGNTKKNPITGVAAAMGVTRQTSHNYMNAVKALAKSRFGEHFFGRS